MSSKEEPRIFIGGLSWNTTERHLQEAFSPFGKVVEAQHTKSPILFREAVNFLVIPTEAIVYGDNLIVK